MGGCKMLVICIDFVSSSWSCIGMVFEPPSIYYLEIEFKVVCRRSFSLLCHYIRWCFLLFQLMPVHLYGWLSDSPEIISGYSKRSEKYLSHAGPRFLLKENGFALYGIDYHHKNSVLHNIHYSVYTSVEIWMRNCSWCKERLGPTSIQLFTVPHSYIWWLKHNSLMLDSIW